MVASLLVSLKSHLNKGSFEKPKLVGILVGKHGFGKDRFGQTAPEWHEFFYLKPSFEKPNYQKPNFERPIFEKPRFQETSLFAKNA